MTEMEFAERLKRFRKAKNLTQQELADLLGVSNKSVSRWESGGGYPDVALLAPLARALDVTVDALLCDEPPIRTLNTADWQNLLSFAFAVGGGVLFFLLDLFAPTLVCYLLYLGAMAYGVYLQNRYTYHSRWFRMANLAMNFFVNFAVCGLVTSAGWMLFLQWYLSFLTGGEVPFGTVPFNELSLGNISLFAGFPSPLSNFTQSALVLGIVQVLLAALLTILTGWIIRVVSAGQRPRLTWNGRLSPWDALPCGLTLLPLLFWVVYRTLYVPEWLYRYQNPAYVVLVVLICLGCCLILVRKERQAIVPALVLLPTLSAILWLLADRSCVWSTHSGEILVVDTVSPIYLPFGQFVWSMVPWAAGFLLFYIFFRRIRINLSNITSL